MKTKVDQGWLSSPEKVSLSHNEAHVWHAILDVPAPCVRVFEHTLTPDEQDRAAQFRLPHLRQRFITARGILRAILGRYLGVAPQTLRFGYTSYGKPFLKSEGDQALLSFNVTHAESVALYAVARERAVGVDIETQRYIADASMIAARHFSLLENHMLNSLPAMERPLAFLRCWTRKEAYIKARGIGLSLPLDQFSVTLTPNEPARLLHTDHDPAAAERWELRDLVMGPDNVAALAVEGHDWQLTCWEWSG
jgi:4'-phosphopantetheinyl transferase